MSDRPTPSDVRDPLPDKMDGRQQTAAERRRFNQLQRAAKRPMTDEEFDRHMNSLDTTGIPND